MADHVLTGLVDRSHEIGRTGVVEARSGQGAAQILANARELLRLGGAAVLPKCLCTLL